MKKIYVLITTLLVSTICFGAAGFKLNNTITDSTFIIKAKNMEITVSAAVGARILSLKLDGKEMLTGSEVHPKFYGSTLWLSPEGKWKGQGILDDKGYRIDKATATNLRLTSQNDTLRGFSFIKEFTASPKDTSIIIKYTITNIAKDMQSVSPWEVTRVHTGGIAFYPKDEYPELKTSTLKHQDIDGVVWYPFDSSNNAAHKLYLFGEEGWIAYVYKGTLFIKQFPILKQNETAPGEVNTEIYVNKPNTYMEIENQGSFKELQHGQSLNYQVKWYVRQIPASLTAEVGNQALVNYVRSVLKIKKK